MPISPPDTASPSPPPSYRQPPAYSRTRSSASNMHSSGRRGSHTSSRPDPWAMRDSLVDKTRRLGEWIILRFMALRIWQRITVMILLLSISVLTILFFVYNEQIMVWLQPKAEVWSNRTGGWTLLWAFIFVTAFPPMIGYSTAVTITGFIYGLPNGWFIVASANIVGSFCAFLTSRYLLRSFVERRVASDQRFAALSLVLKHDGIKLLTMIRLCPLPYSLSNGALSTFPTIQPLAFVLATAIASPKLLIHVFIGSRLAVIGKEGGEMDSATKAVNYSSIAFGMLLGIVTGVLIYRRTQARARQLEAEERQKSLEHANQNGGLSHPDAFVDDEEATLEGVALRGDEIDFLDDDTEEFRDEDHGKGTMGIQK